jgi:hypothetical protein
MKSGHCYICYSQEFNCLVRPIYNVRQSFWDPSFKFPLGSSAIFSANTFWADCQPPHCYDDVLVETTDIRMTGFEPPIKMFYLLGNLAKTSVSNIFGSQISSWKFVIEGTQCPSVGILKLLRSAVNLYISEEGKKRLRFVDSNLTLLDLPLTATDDPFFDDCGPFEEILVLIGLGRPFSGLYLIFISYLIKFNKICKIV